MLTYIALGSNIGDKLFYLQQARHKLRNLSTDHILRQSSVYQTSPIDCLDGSPDFLNAVIAIDYAGTAEDLLAQTQLIENQLDRTRFAINSPRTIDVDILCFGDQLLSEKKLELPHPRMHLRRFVIEPLCEIAPDLRIPGLKFTAAEYLCDLKGTQRIELHRKDW